MSSENLFFFLLVTQIDLKIPLLSSPNVITVHIYLSQNKWEKKTLESFISI